MNNKIYEAPPTPKLSGIATKLLMVYTEWQQHLPTIAKTLRYSLGVRIDQLFAEVISLTAEAQFSIKDIRQEIIRKAIIKNDTLKFMLFCLFELKGIDNKKFLSLSIKLEEIGRMLYGWKNQCLKNNKSNKTEK